MFCCVTFTLIGGMKKKKKKNYFYGLHYETQLENPWSDEKEKCLIVVNSS